MEIFVEDAKKDKELIWILDSSIFQFQIYTFLEKNTPYQMVEDFIKDLFKIISELNPTLIYIYRMNVEDAIAALEKVRGIEFLERIWERDKDKPFYQNRPIGAEGYREFLRNYHCIAQKLFEVTPFNKLDLEVTDENWEQYESNIYSFLKIEKVNFDRKIIFPIGKYENENLGLTIEIHEGYLLDPFGKKKLLVPKNANEFYIEDLPTILNFEVPDRLLIKGDQLIESWTTNNTEFIKVY